MRVTLSVVRQRTLEGGATNPENSDHEFSSNGSGMELNKKIEAFTSNLGESGSRLDILR